MERAATTIAMGFAFPECPRWHDGQLWFSDQHDCKVHVLTPEGATVETFDVPGRPSVVSMLERRLYRRHGGKLSPYADLTALHPGHSNDMVVDAAGRAYVGNIGFDFHAGEAFRPTAIALVTPDGAVSVAADEVACPNGSVIAPDGRSLIVAESFGMRLMEFDIAPDGALTNRRVFAELRGLVPDGICLDAEGCVWVAVPYAGAAIRVARGGEVLHRVPIPGGAAYACMLGGADGRDLFLACATGHDPHETVKVLNGRIDVARAPAPGAGWP